MSTRKFHGALLVAFLALFAALPAVAAARRALARRNWTMADA